MAKTRVIDPGVGQPPARPFKRWLLADLEVKGTQGPHSKHEVEHPWWKVMLDFLFFSVRPLRTFNFQVRKQPTPEGVRSRLTRVRYPPGTHYSVTSRSVLSTFTACFFGWTSVPYVFA